MRKFKNTGSSDEGLLETLREDGVGAELREVDSVGDNSGHVDKLANEQEPDHSQSCVLGRLIDLDRITVGIDHVIDLRDGVGANERKESDECRTDDSENTKYEHDDVEDLVLSI